MKLIKVLAFLPLAAFGQNLQYDQTANIEFDVMPKQNTYIGLTKVCLKPVSGNDYMYKSNMESFVNRRVYTIVENPDQADFYFTYHVTSVTTNPQRTSSKSETKTRKDGSTYTETTYTTELNERVTVDVIMYTKEGTQVQSGRNTKDLAHSASSSSRDNSITEMNNKRNNTQQTEVGGLLNTTFSAIEAEYMIDGRTIMPFSIGVKSRKMDYSDVNKVAELLSTWMKTKTYDANDAGIQEAMKLIDQALTEHEPENKKARIDNEVAAVLYYDKAFIFFALKQYKEANEMIVKSESLDKRTHYTQETLKDLLVTMKERKMYN